MVPTAEETFKENFSIGMVNKDFKSFKEDYPTLFNVIIDTIKQQNKLHLEAQKKAIIEDVCLTDESYYSQQEGSCLEIDKESILNAYPLENIK